MSYYWTCGSGRIALEFESLEQIERCGPPGDASDAVAALSQEPAILNQLRGWDPEDLRDTLREYGCWDATELADHAQNQQRMLWIAASDVLEEPELYGNEDDELPKQFEDVPSKYGAPMGRPEYVHNPEAVVELFRVRMVDGDYDDGGAYWGGGGRDTPPLFCARDAEGEVQRFIRAKDRAEAKALLLEDYPDLIVKEAE